MKDRTYQIVLDGIVIDVYKRQDLHRTFVFDAFLQRNLPSDGNQYQPECEIAAGEPAAFYAADVYKRQSLLSSTSCDIIILEFKHKERKLHENCDCG